MLSGFFKSSKFLTSLISAAFVFRKCSRFELGSSISSVGPKLLSSSSLATIVFSKTECMLARTFSTARAKGRSNTSTLSAGSQDRTPFSFAVVDASRNRTTINAANISPVPLKKQSISGTSILNILGVPSARREEPITESVDFEVDSSWGKRTEVTIICGIWCTLCSFVMASVRLSSDVILHSDKSLFPSVRFYRIRHQKNETYSASN